MARIRAPGRLGEILDAALDVFCELGYRRARMQDVAERAGVSPGLLYTYASGKEALFLLVVEREAGIDVDALPLPLRDPDRAEIAALVRRVLRGRGLPAFNAAEKVEAPEDVRAEFGAILDEHYEHIFRVRNVIRLVERTALDWPELADLFFNQTRAPFVRRLGRYVERRVASGHFRPVPDVAAAARFILETVAWFAYHRYNDRGGKPIDDTVARITVIELVTNSFVAP